MSNNQKLVSINGNIFSLHHGPVKVGYATRGRGFWVGKKHEDEHNPDIDNPSMYSAQVLVTKDFDSHDGFEDSLALLDGRKFSDLRRMTQQNYTRLREMAEAAYGRRLGKSLGGIRCKLVALDPELLSDDDLLKGLVSIKRLASVPDLNTTERGIIKNYAKRYGVALRNYNDAFNILNKAILTKKHEEKPDAPKAKMPPAKAQETRGDAKGKVQYKYPKNGNGKGPNSDGVKPKNGQPEEEEQEGVPEEPEITPPPHVDPEPFAKKIGVKVELLQKLADTKSREIFVHFFMDHEDLVEKLGITSGFLERLHESLTSPHPPEEPQNPQQPNPQQPPPM